MHCDIGVDPMTLTDDERSIRSVINKKRRVGWTNQKYPIVRDLDDINAIDLRYPNQKPDIIQEAEDRGFKFLPLFDNGVESGVGREKHKKLLTIPKKVVENDALIYNPDYYGQALAAKRELLRRGGFWNESGGPVHAIYLARLMGYGEEYIRAFIERNFLWFNVHDYMSKHSRERLLEWVNC